MSDFGAPKTEDDLYKKFLNELQGRLKGILPPGDHQLQFLRSLTEQIDSRPWLGVVMQPITPPMVQTFGLPRLDGAFVSQKPSAASPAGIAGIEFGDVITDVNDKHITSPADVSRIIGSLAPGSNVTLEILHNKEPKHLSVVLTGRGAQGEPLTVTSDPDAARVQLQICFPVLTNAFHGYAAVKANYERSERPPSACEGPLITIARTSNRTLVEKIGQDAVKQAKTGRIPSLLLGLSISVNDPHDAIISEFLYLLPYHVPSADPAQPQLRKFYEEFMNALPEVRPPGNFELARTITDQINACLPFLIEPFEQAAEQIGEVQQAQKDESDRLQQQMQESIGQDKRRHQAEAEDKMQRQREQEAADEARGYPHITVETFMLDGKDLASVGAKAAIAGAYVREGNLDNLYADRRALFMARQDNSQPNVPLVTDDASRDFRQQLLRCQSDASSHLGCLVTVLGHATTCKLSNAFGAGREEPCLTVEDGRLSDGQ
jgi:hypothetical protein